MPKTTDTPQRGPGAPGLSGGSGASPVVTWTLLEENLQLVEAFAEANGIDLRDRGAVPRSARELLSAAMRDRRFMTRYGLRDLCEATIAADAAAN